MTEKKVVYRVWPVWAFEQEEQWLNSMALQGWALESVNFIKYSFVPCQPGEYTIRLEMHLPDKDYDSILHEMGAEKICQVLHWVYYRRPSALGEFRLFSDIDSRIKHLDKISRAVFVIGIANLLMGLLYMPVSRLNLLGACLLFYALGRLHGKATELKKDRCLYE